MSIGAFIDKERPPTIEQVLEVIGPKQLAWEKFTRFIREEFAAREEFRFNGRNYGWAFRFRKGGKALASLYHAVGSFTVQVILSETDVARTRRLGIGKRVQGIIDQAHAYPEGRWLFIPIQSEKDVRDAQRLLALKLGNAGRKRKSYSTK